MESNKRSFFIFIFFIISFITFSQNIEISGKVTDLNNNPLEYVNALLLNQDSSYVKGVVTNANGEFTISGSIATTLVLKLQSLGFEDVNRTLDTSKSKIDLSTIRMQNDTQFLQEVTITTEKPLIERRSDRLIVNVSNSILATGSNSLELLERAPGIFIEDNGISLRGRTGVNVQINGRQQRLSATDLNNYLQSIPSSQIERIEIINNPSAAFDAEGSAGVINIVLKKDGKLGTNGSANASYGLGLYHRTSEGFSLNNRNSRTSLYLGINHNYDQRYNQLIATRRFSENGEVVTTFDQNSSSVTPTHSYMANIGMDYRIGERSIIGADITTNWSNSDQDANGIAVILDENNNPSGSFLTETDSKDHQFNFASNVNYRSSFGENKGDFIFNADYATYRNTADQFFTTNITDNGNNSTEKLMGTIDGSLELFVLKADLNLTQNSFGNISFGLKSSFVINDSDLDYFDVENGTTVPNEIYTNQFKYKENINAAYGNWKLAKNKWTYQLGLRTEQTISKGEQVDGTIQFGKNYVQLFPSLFVEHKPSDKQTFGFNASRRINRPNYNQLNPIRTFVDITTSRAGNPELVPEIAANLELIYNYAKWLDVSLSYSNTKDRILPVLIQDDVNQSTTVQLVNIDDYNYLGVNTSITLKPVKSLSSRWDLEFFYNEFLGLVNGYALSEKGSSFRLRSYNNYKFGDGWATELNGFYQPLYHFGITSFEPRWKVDFGIEKAVLNKNGKIKLAVTDIFWKFFPRGFTDFGNINEDFRSVRDTRVATISFSYNFGNNKVGVNKIEGGAKEEKSRT